MFDPGDIQAHTPKQQALDYTQCLHPLLWKAGYTYDAARKPRVSCANCGRTFVLDPAFARNVWDVAMLRQVLAAWRAGHSIRKASRLTGLTHYKVWVWYKKFKAHAAGAVLE